MTNTSVEQAQVTVRGRSSRVFLGGTGEALLLVHGGWGGARMHWSPVWDLLCKRHRIIAPDLPGLGAVEQAPLSSVASYAAWLVELLDALGVDRAWCVGNSFGGSVVWSLAGRSPERCAGLVMINGIPMPKTPPLLRLLGDTPFGRAIMRRIVRRWSYSRSAIPLAFSNSSHVPRELERLTTTEWPLIVRRFANILIAGDGPPPPRVKPLLLWGADDRLPGTKRKDATQLEQKLPGATLRFLENAGHFPQIEVPGEFVAALEIFVTSAPAREHAVRDSPSA